MARHSPIEESAHWFQGDDQVFRFTIFSNGTTTPVDITGWLVSWTLSEAAFSEEVLMEKTVGDGVTLTTPASGILDVLVDAADTTALEAGTYWHSLRRTGTGTGEELVYGKAVLLRSPG